MVVLNTSRRITSSLWGRFLKTNSSSSRRNLSCSQGRTDQQTTLHQSEIKKDALLENFFPQPVSTSHPHLMKIGEITPLITKEEYATRRCNLMNEIHQLSDSTKANIVLVPSASKAYMSDKIPYVFRQNSDFFYLTGCMEPDVILVMTTLPGTDKFETTLFMPKTDSNTETWEGPRLSLPFVINCLGIKQAAYTSHLGAFLSSFIGENSKSGVQIWRDSGRSCRVVEDVLSQKGGTIPTQDLVPVIHHLRLIKSKAEQELMRKSCSIIADAVIEAMKISKPSICESHLWATVDYQSRINGAQYLAYPPVVAGGSRANTIHYISNNQLIKDGEMVLMDAGCQYHGYTSDMTRCWPINGKFTSYQKEAYEAVLDVQLDLIKFCNELPPLDALFQRMCRNLGKNLQEIGFGRDITKCIERAQMAFSVCPHHVSHYLGLDVHDTGRVKRSLPLQPGMVITIEPGLYVDLNRQVAPKEFYGLGLRIEDDVLITEYGVEVLTQSCPKTVTDIEKVMR